MAATTLAHCLQLPHSYCKDSPSKLSYNTFHQPQLFLPLKFKTHSHSLSLSLPTNTTSSPLFLTRSSDNGTEPDTPAPPPPPHQQPASESSDQLSEVGAEIKKVLMERQSRGEGESDGFFSGVVEEIGEIEWPEFGKVLGTTGVVLAVITGSSLVLLSLNGLLAELSDSLFAGRGVQDFF